jgi:glutathione S-transferase
MGGRRYEAKKVDPRSESYRSINPLGAVPAIDIGGPRPMTEAGAILQYIADRYTHRDLGADPGLEARFEFNEVMSFLTGDFHPAFWPYFTPQRFTIKEDAESLASVRTAAHGRVDRVLTYLDGLIGDTGHVYRGKRTVADAYAFVMARWSENFPKKWRDYSNLAPFMQQMASDPSVTQVIEHSKR